MTTTATATIAGTRTVADTGTPGNRQNPSVPRMPLTRVGPLGVALTLWDIWRRLPPRQRRFLVKQARTHGPRLAKQAAAAAAAQKRRR